MPDLLSIRPPILSELFVSRAKEPGNLDPFLQTNVTKRRHMLYILFSKTSLDPLSGATPFRATLKQERLGDDRCLQVPLTHLSRIRV